MGQVFKTVLTCLGLIFLAARGLTQPASVLWWDASPPYPQASGPADREKMARYLDGYDGGALFDVTFRHSTRRGELARPVRAGLRHPCF